MADIVVATKTIPKPKAHRAAQLWSRRAPLLPALVFMILATQVPFLLTIYYSFQKWILLVPNQTFAGFGNYVQVLTDPYFWTAALNSVVFTVGTLILSIVIGLTFALLLDRKFVGRGVARTLLITPFLIVPAAGALIWKTSMLDATNGIVNWLLSLVGVNGVAWASQYPQLTIIAVLTWQWTPFVMLILLAGLQSQPTDILESARVDGANGLQVFRYMTWPHLRVYLELASILGAINILQTFDPVFLITQGGPGSATTNLPYYLYLETFQAGNIGVASAAGVLVVLATIVIATFALRLLSTAFRLGGGR